MIAVFNSSPLIFLSKLSIIDQALKLFSEVNIPAYVRKEILHKEDIASDKLKALLRSNSIGHSSNFVILDDHVARTEARRIGLNVKGTLGIIKRLMELDVIQYELDKLYRDLSGMKFRVKRGIFDQIFKL